MVWNLIQADIVLIAEIFVRPIIVIKTRLYICTIFMLNHPMILRGINSLDEIHS